MRRQCSHSKAVLKYGKKIRVSCTEWLLEKSESCKNYRALAMPAYDNGFQPRPACWCPERLVDTGATVVLFMAKFGAAAASMHPLG
jgi:hypothetical protein